MHTEIESLKCPQLHAHTTKRAAILPWNQNNNNNWYLLRCNKFNLLIGYNVHIAISHNFLGFSKCERKKITYTLAPNRIENESVEFSARECKCKRFFFSHFEKPINYVRSQNEIEIWINWFFRSTLDWKQSIQWDVGVVHFQSIICFLFFRSILLKIIQSSVIFQMAELSQPICRSEETIPRCTRQWIVCSWNLWNNTFVQFYFSHIHCNCKS